MSMNQQFKTLTDLGTPMKIRNDEYRKQKYMLKKVQNTLLETKLRTFTIKIFIFKRFLSF